MKKEPDFSHLDIKGLIELFQRYQIDELNLEENGLTVEVKRNLPLSMQSKVDNPQSFLSPDTFIRTLSPANPVLQKEIDKEGSPQEQSQFEEINSPMVGTMYSSPSPEDPPFVKEGDYVTPESTVCIIEAMKMMNEIKPEKSGRIHKILVQNGEPVQLEQALFLIDAKA